MVRALGLATTVLIASWAASAAGPFPPQASSQLVEVARESYLMGTIATLVTYATTRDEGMQRLERMLGQLEATEADLSTWRDDTPLAVLNRVPVGVRALVSPSFCDLFTTLNEWYRETSGAFDPGLGALISAWGIRGTAHRPEPDVLAAARRRSGWKHVSFDSKACVLTRKQPVELEEGAFGKGEALDRARALVAGSDGNALAWMIDLGGQVAAGGAPPGRRGWAVEIAHPVHRDRAVAEVVLLSGSIATSGGSERDQHVGSKRVGHILDPRTGLPASFDGSVVVWHERALVADVLSTALYVMGPEEGLAWASTRGIAVCYLTPDSGAADAPPTIRASAAFLGRFGSRGRLQ
jgi:FAD:protein FMN transferase